MKKLLLVFLLSWLGLARSYAQQFPVDVLLENGPSDRQINLVYVAEGYQASEMGKFITDANSALNGLLSQSPFKEYRSYFNAYAVRVPSAQSGASHAANLADCGTQPALTVNNYFGTQFDNGGIHRLLYPTRLSTVSSVLAASFPAFDQVFVITNTTYYGGAGGSVATFSVHASANEISIHEIGHTFANLADEYWAGPQYAIERPNLTKQSDPLQIKWKNWLNTNGVGIYPHTADPTWFRPHNNCKMQLLGVPFCSVCKEAFVERIHGLLPPLVSYQPATTTLPTPTQDLQFSLALIKPEPNTLKVTWRRNGVVIARNRDQTTVPLSALAQGTNKIQAEIIDTTALTRSPTHVTQHAYVVEWTVNNVVTGVQITAAQREYNIEVYPNPVGEFLKLTYTLPKQARVEVAVLDGSGRKLKTIVRQQQAAGSHEYRLSPEDAHMQKPGLYVLVLDIDGSRVSKKLTRE